ncbi:MAG: aspartate carbamoyltransferase regulatory subunit [Acidobacteria bacterium]|nr:MAG: aspartate carbamoyltransferase regulatory subunit [Acidobacteriota bacterium]PIE89404.1 MAG: aspartate carbamoyltransferase regulatory subunit [Acidobacteriota bacterium]
MRIERIGNGIVLDHIQAGMGIEILNLFPKKLLKTKIDYASFIESPSLGEKDIIKIENMDVDPSTLMKMAILSPKITISIIREGKVKEKIRPTVPPIVEGVLSCNNPKCVSQQETYLTSKFKVTRGETTLTKQCLYCEHIKKSKLKLSS